MRLLPARLRRGVVRAGVVAGLLWVSLPSVAGAAPASTSRSRLVFGGREGVRTMDAAGGPMQLVVAPIGTQPDDMPWNPTWSPDGQWIAYMRGWGIWVVHPDGSDNHPVAGLKANVPSWSADSRYVYFTRFDYGLETHIESVAIDGTPGPRFDNPTGLPESGAQWSPDGTRVAFGRRDEDGIYRAYLMHADGSGLRAMSSGETDDYVVDWSPDGRQLLVISITHDNSRADAVVMDADGGNRRVLRQNALPWAWSPDGRKILFTDGPGPGVESMNVDGTGVRFVSPGVGADWGPGTVDPDPTPATTTPAPSLTSVAASPAVPTAVGAGSATTSAPARTAPTVRSSAPPSAPASPASTPATAGATPAPSHGPTAAEEARGAPGDATASGVGIAAVGEHPGSPTRAPAIAVAGFLLAAVFASTVCRGLLGHASR